MNTPTLKKVLLLFGGESAEHDVSIVSAQNIFTALDLTKVEPLLCYIDTKGRWWHTRSITEAKDARTSLIPVPGSSSVEVDGNTVHIDVIFPVLHGTNGEDGTVQGLAKLLHTPIVGCDIDGSAICIDKVLAKRLLEASGVPVVPFVVYHAGEAMPDFLDVTKKLGKTLFVKPVRQGSSVGVGKATTSAEFTAALKTALQFDSDVLIESAVVDARELEIAMLGPTYHAKASVVGEVVPDRDFYTYESKYDSGSTTQTVIPADISPALTLKAQEYARRAFGILRCRGLARVDFLLDVNGALYLNEVNTLPGFTNISMYPKLWEVSGYSYQELVGLLIDAAE